MLAARLALFFMRMGRCGSRPASACARNAARPIGRRVLLGYKKRNDFPIDEEDAPTWDETTAIVFVEEHAKSAIATPIPAYVVTVTANLETLGVSMTKA